MFRAEESFSSRVIEVREQLIEEAFDVQQRAGLTMDPDLYPAEHFKYLIQRSIAARQRDKSIGALRHRRFALVHRGNDAKLGNPRMRDLYGSQGLR